MIDLNLRVPILTLSKSGLNITEIGSGWIQKQDPALCCLQETYCECEDKTRLKKRIENNVLY